jgi:DNA primase
MDKREAKKILSSAIGAYRETGRELLFTCPACDHYKRKLSINLDKNAFKCWVCDYRGRNLRRIVRRFGNFVQLQKWDQITSRLDLEKFSDLFSDSSPPANSKQIIDLPESFLSLANKNLPATAKFAYGYLTSRGVTNEDIVRWKIGYCFEGEYRNRVIVPSFDDSGDVNYFVARSYNGDSYKYKNPRVSKNIIFNELFIDWDSDLTIVEGAFDAVIAGNSVPLLGSTLSPRSPLIRKIVFNDTPVYLALDPDAAHKERRIIETLLSYDIELYKIDVCGYEDVGAMPKEIFRERKEQASFIDQDNYLLLNLLSTI